MTYKNLLAACTAMCILTCGAAYAHDNTKLDTSRMQDKSTDLRFAQEKVAASTYTPLFAWPVDSQHITIKGTAELTEEQMLAYIKANTKSVKLNCSLEDLVSYYYQECGIEGVRADIALCQAIKETGWFNYGGTVVPEQNNYCGLGTTSSTIKGHYFDTPRLGVRAHIHHLLVYAQKEHPRQILADPRFHLVIEKYPEYHGKMQHWTDLNGRWAVPGTHYGEEILALWEDAKTGKHNEGLLAQVKEKVKAQPEDLEILHAYAKLAKNLGANKDAEKAYKKLLTMDAEAKTPYLELASLYKDWGFDSKAIDVYDKLLAIYPANQEALRGKAYELAFLGESRRAVQLYSEVLKLDPQDTLALYNRGHLYKKLGRKALGEADLAALKNLQK